MDLERVGFDFLCCRCKNSRVLYKFVNWLKIDDLNTSALAGNHLWALSGEASINPNGCEIVEAGFVYTYGDWGTSYDSGITVMSEIVDNKIKMDKISLTHRGSQGVFVRVYVIISSGEIIHNEKSIYVGPSLDYDSEKESF